MINFIILMILTMLPLIFFFWIILSGFLFNTKIGRKFIYKMGYRSKATLGQFKTYKNNPYVKNETDRIFSLMMKDYLNFYKHENLKDIEEFIPIFINVYRDSYLEKILEEKNKMRKPYFQQLLISLREVRKMAFEKINAK